MKFHLETKMPCGFLWWKTTTLSSKCLNAVEVAESQLTDFAKVFSSLVMKMFKNSGVIKIPNFEFKWTCFLLNGSWQFQTFERFARLCCILKKHGYFCKKSKKTKNKRKKKNTVKHQVFWKVTSRRWMCFGKCMGKSLSSDLWTPILKGEIFTHFIF